MELTNEIHGEELISHGDSEAEAERPIHVDVQQVEKEIIVGETQFNKKMIRIANVRDVRIAITAT